ncbi:MAG: ABC transporter permease [Candidatus Hodarchaeales archaeon]|jgi:ABC-2 type transport system permease protein
MTSPLGVYLSRILDAKPILIASEEIRNVFKTLKFKFMLFVMLLPVLLQILTSEQTNNTIGGIPGLFQRLAGGQILGFWTGWAAQILVIFLAADMIAGEEENDTLKILLSKPVRKSEILLGKMLGFAIYIGVVTTIVLWGFGVVLIWQENGGYDDFWDIILKYLLPGVSVVLLGLITCASLTVMLSAGLKRSLYAGLTGLLLVFGHAIIGPILLGEELADFEFTLNYQLGILLEQFYLLSPAENVYEGDPLTAFVLLVSLNLIFLSTALILFYRREVN